MHFLTEPELACFRKLFLATAPVNRGHPGLATLLDRGWAICGDDGVASLTEDGHQVGTYLMPIGWERGDEAADSCAR